MSAKGDDLERLKGLFDFEMFRATLCQAVPRSDGSKGGRPPSDRVLMFKVLVLQSMHSLSDERCEYLIKDRLSFMRFLGLGLADAVPDANTIWTFREALTRATIEGEPAMGVLFKRFDAAVKASGYLAMGGQIVDATIVAAPKQRNRRPRRMRSRTAAFRKERLMKSPRFAPLFALLATILAGASGAHADVTSVRVGVIPVIGASPLFVANGEGWLKDAGLELSIKTFESGPNIIQAAASGGIDLYVAGIAPIALGRAKGVDFRVVTASAVDENVLVAGQKLQSYLQHGAAPAEAFRRFHAEAGHAAKIATQPPGSVPAANLQYWLHEVAHIDPADVQVIGIGIDATQQAILAGAVDAAIVREPTLTIIQQRNPQIGIIAPGEKLFPGQPGTVVAVYGTFLEKHPQQVQAIVDAILRAIDELQKSPDRTVPHIEAALSKGIVKPEVIRTSLTSPAVHFVADPNQIRAPTAALLAYQAKLGAFPKAPSLDGLFDTSFYDKAVKARAESARQEGAADDIRHRAPPDQ